MKPEQKPADQTTGNRRKFLLDATLGSAGIVAAVVTAATVKDSLGIVDPSSKKAEKKIKGYHETEHIRQYYETTRI